MGFKSNLNNFLVLIFKIALMYMQCKNEDDERARPSFLPV